MDILSCLRPRLIHLVIAKMSKNDIEDVCDLGIMKGRLILYCIDKWYKRFYLWIWQIKANFFRKTVVTRKKRRRFINKINQMDALPTELPDGCSTN